MNIYQRILISQNLKFIIEKLLVGTLKRV